MGREYFENLIEKYCSNLNAERLYYENFKENVKSIDVEKLYDEIIKEAFLERLIDKYNMTDEDSLELFRRDELLRMCILSNLMKQGDSK